MKILKLFFVFHTAWSRREKESVLVSTEPKDADAQSGDGTINNDNEIGRETEVRGVQNPSLQSEENEPLKLEEEAPKNEAKAPESEPQDFLLELDNSVSSEETLKDANDTSGLDPFTVQETAVTTSHAKHLGAHSSALHLMSLDLSEESDEFKEFDESDVSMVDLLTQESKLYNANQNDDDAQLIVKGATRSGTPPTDNHDNVTLLESKSLEKPLTYLQEDEISQQHSEELVTNNNDIDPLPEMKMETDRSKTKMITELTQQDRHEVTTSSLKQNNTTRVDTENKDAATTSQFEPLLLVQPIEDLDTKSDKKTATYEKEDKEQDTEKEEEEPIFILYNGTGSKAFEGSPNTTIRLQDAYVIQDQALRPTAQIVPDDDGYQNSTMNNPAYVFSSTIDTSLILGVSKTFKKSFLQKADNYMTTIKGWIDGAKTRVRNFLEGDEDRKNHAKPNVPGLTPDAPNEAVPSLTNGGDAEDNNNAFISADTNTKAKLDDSVNPDDITYSMRGPTGMRGPENGFDNALSKMHQNIPQPPDYAENKIWVRHFTIFGWVLFFITYIIFIMCGILASYRNADLDCVQTATTFYFTSIGGAFLQRCNYQHSVSEFARSFHNNPVNPSLVVTIFRETTVESFYDLTRWRGDNYSNIYHFALDLSQWITHQPLTQEAHEHIHKFVNDKSSIASCSIYKTVEWPEWEEVACNIKIALRERGYHTVRVDLNDKSITEVHKNTTMRRFLHSVSGRAFLALSIIGAVLTSLYECVFGRTHQVNMRYKVQVDKQVFWSLIQDRFNELGFLQHRYMAFL